MSAEALTTLLQKSAQAKAGGGKERLEKHRAGGRNTARERLALLLDHGSFVESDLLAGSEDNGSGVVTGSGLIAGRPVLVFSQDATVSGGALGAVHAQKIVKILDRAIASGIPVIGINDSGGAKIQEGVESLGGYADIFYRNVAASGVVPQISLICGPCAGGAVYSPALTDFVFMTEKTSFMFITGPEVIKQVTFEDISKEDLGGAAAHTEKSGVCARSFPTEEELFASVRELWQFLPSSNRNRSPQGKGADPSERRSAKLNTIVPTGKQTPYDMREVIEEMVDDRYFYELQPLFAPNILIGFAHLGGQSVGIVANQPLAQAGCLDIQASCKAARFVRFCDAFNIPLLTLVDVPGFLPGVAEEHSGIIRHGAKLLYAYAEATVPKLTVITRKAYGGAYDVMSSKHLRGDVNAAWPDSEIAVMGAPGAVKILHGKELAQLSDPIQRQQHESLLVRNYEQQYLTPYTAAALSYLDAVLIPEETRSYLISQLRLLGNKEVTPIRRKHGNIPL